ncbi:CD63 antigen-like [Belonocnema kinseyi]|uniref:CD63 antigen-like n=1 Tax=Belonocnema kinseyi TaxID=2817044 RepID=UPI00143DF477|nr:CD63 antigen-like [Belonocnema kinseyi]
MVAGMKLSTSSQCIKYLMFIFNLLFVITGIILISIGSVIHGVYHSHQDFLDNKFFSVPNLLIAVGVIIFFIAFFGCCGAVRENYCMVVTFATLMVLVFILELSAGIAGYGLRSSASQVITGKMKENMNSYNSSKETAAIWDKLQQNFECCGINSSTDWNVPLNSTGLPISCCEVIPGQISESTCNSQSPNVFKKGCLPVLGDLISAHALQLGGVGIGIAFVQALGIWFSIFLARSIKNSYYTV